MDPSWLMMDPAEAWLTIFCFLLTAVVIVLGHRVRQMEDDLDKLKTADKTLAEVAASQEVDIATLKSFCVLDDLR